jgi:hypothetical protein
VIGDRHPMVKPIRNRDRYLRLFDDAGDAKIIGEATPFYLEDPEAPGSSTTPFPKRRSSSACAIRSSASIRTTS